MNFKNKKWTSHIIAAGAFLVFIILGLACASTYSVPKQYREYSETIDIPELNAGSIYLKTSLWIKEKTKDKESPISDIHLVSEKQINASLRTDGNHGFLTSELANFHIEDKKCQLVMSINRNVTYDKNWPAQWMDVWKNLAKDYREYITAPALSQKEINELTVNGDAAFKVNKYSEAEKYYGQLLKNAPPNADTLAAYGLCLEELNPSLIESYKINTNTIMETFTKHAGKVLDYWVEMGIYLSHGGYRQEKSRLESSYEKDKTNLKLAMEMYDAALSLEPGNETAIMYAYYNKQRKEYIDKRYSEIDTVLNKIYQINEAERKRLDAERIANLRKEQEENWNNVIKNLENLTKSIEQSRGGGNTVSQSQGGASASSSSSGGVSDSSPSKSNNFDIGRARSSYDKDVKIAESAYNNVKSSGDISAQQRRTFQQAQNRMKKTREEASRNGYTISKSKWEDERLP